MLHQSPCHDADRAFLEKVFEDCSHMVLPPLMHRFSVPILAELNLDVIHLERAGS